MNYRWGIFLVDLNPTIGSEQANTRPALIISREELNQILPIVDALSLTSRKPGRKIYPNEVLLPSGTSGLTKESIVLCSQIRALDKRRLRQQMGILEDKVLRESVIHALCFQLGI